MSSWFLQNLSRARFLREYVNCYFDLLEGSCFGRSTVVELMVCRLEIVVLKDANECWNAEDFDESFFRVVNLL